MTAPPNLQQLAFNSSVPGTASNILTGGSATQTNADTYAVTADFVPTDLANYNTLTGLPAGNFVINKATPTATLAVNNSPVTYDGSAKIRNGWHFSVFRSRRCQQHFDWRLGDTDQCQHLRGDSKLYPTDLSQLQHTHRASRWQLHHQQSHTDSHISCEQFTRHIQRRRQISNSQHYSLFCSRRSQQYFDRRRGDADQR